MEHIVSIIALITVLSALTYHYLTSTYGYWKKRSIPCLAGALPGLGHVYPMLFLQRNMGDLFRDFYNKMPGHSMIGYYHLLTPALLIRDPELAKTVLLKNFQNFSDNGFELDPEYDAMLRANPFFSIGEYWKTSRHRLTLGLTSGKLKTMYTFIDGTCTKLKEFLNNLVKSSNFVEMELKDLFSRFTADVVASVAFGADGESFKSEKDGSFRRAGKLMFERSVTSGIRTMVLFFVPFLSKLFRVRFMPDEADKFFKKVVADVVRHREEQGIQRPDFLQHIIQERKTGDVVLKTDLEFDDVMYITSHAVSLFFDGYETSSITLSFFAYQLAVYPEVQDRVREEVMNVVAKHDGLTYAALQEMTYMDQALNESMRLFPGFGTLIKVCTKEIELVGSDGITCQLTPGTSVVISVTALQRDPEYWPDPEKFDPERFSEENKRSRNRFVYLPFGDGPRICPGMRLALLQMKAAIATVIQSFTWEVSPRTKEPIELDPRYWMTSAVGGLWVNMKRL